MSVWVVVGGQYGSESKGKIAAFITLREKIDICVRTGGPNAGHCFVDASGAYHKLRQIPSGCVRPETRLLIPSGGLIDLEILRGELDVLQLSPDSVGVDLHAMVITEQDRLNEIGLDLQGHISSTLCGVGSATSRRVLRSGDVGLAKDAVVSHPWIKPYLVDTAKEINEGVDRGKSVLVEGTQGFGLSLYHSAEYPKATSRDTSAAGCISECGISPRVVTNVVMVLRTFPIRVAGQQAGTLFDETNWETIQRESGYPHAIAEYTTVTRKLRRVGRFDMELARRAVAVNRPTELALNFMDYLDVADSAAGSVESLSGKSKHFIQNLENQLGVLVGYVGSSPLVSKTIRTR
jgi:adenylosuccinate synthase